MFNVNVNVNAPDPEEIHICGSADLPIASVGFEML
jgi:hypothetical protein